jgi:hypothetical protein
MPKHGLAINFMFNTYLPFIAFLISLLSREATKDKLASIRKQGENK